MQSQGPSPEIIQLLQQGIAALEGGNPALARDNLKRVVALGHVNASVYLALAMAHEKLSESAEMVAALERSLEMEAVNPRALIMMADHYNNTGDHRAAASYYQQALGIKFPNDQVPPELKPFFDEAQRKLEQISTKFADYLDQQMAPAFAKNDDADGLVQKSMDLMLGRKKVYYQEPQQYYFPDLPHKEFYDASDFDWVPALEAQTDVILEELKGVMSEKQLFDAYIKQEEDRPYFDFHGMQDDDSWSAFYLWRNGELVKEAAEKCPKTLKALEEVPILHMGQRSPNILFSVLKPGAKIPPHTGMTNTRLIGHLGLVVPEGCGFRVGNDVRHWQKGKVWLFDDTIEHEAWNDSDQTRYILLFEVWKPELSEAERALVTKLFESIDQYKA